MERRALSREGRPAKRERLWGATVKADFIHQRCFVSRQGGELTTRRLLLTLAMVCLVAPVTTGCQFGHSHQAAVEPHYGQLEQACFGYEPTVWRNMPGQCEQAVRLIPDEVIQLPAAAPAQATPDSAPPTEPVPGGLPLDQVPEPGQESSALPRIMDVGPADQPPAETTPPATPPAAPDEAAKEPAALEPAMPPESAPQEPTPPEPAQPEPAQPEPAQPEPQPPSGDEPKKTDAPPAVEPATPPAPPTPEPSVSVRKTRKPVTPVALRPTRYSTNVAAAKLFRSVEQALSETMDSGKSARQRVTEKNTAVGLARFISY
jgi:hypothetical protein